MSRSGCWLLWVCGFGDLVSVWVSVEDGLIFVCLVCDWLGLG